MDRELELKERREQFYTTRPTRAQRNDKKKHLSLDMEIQQQHSIVQAESNNRHRDALNIHYLSKTQQIVRERIHSSKDLTIIDLSKCSLSQIPKLIFMDNIFAETLKELNISHNKLPSIPPSISLLSRLVVLDCAFNEITDLPAELADLSELQHLNLVGNPLKAALKQPLLLGTAEVLKHLRDRRRNSSGSMRKRDRIRELLQSRSQEPITPPSLSPAGPPTLLKPLPKIEHATPPPSPPPPLEEEYGNPLVAQMKLGLEASIGLSTSSASANNKFKSLLMDGRGAHFKFNTYCNSQFASLRAMAGVDTEAFRQSLGSVTALGFSGKSGSVLLRSADNLLVLKTISNEESKFLRRILAQYCEYMKRHPNTVLTRFWGLYKVIKSPVVKVSFIVMKNAFSSGHKIHERYDLKGSRVGRHSGEENLRLSRVMLKDLDLCQMNRRIRLGPSRRQHFLDQITSDCKFLEKFEIIDYSLILGIHYTDDGVGTGAGGETSDEAHNKSTSPPTQERLYGEIIGKDADNAVVDEMYFMTIIDVLQPYNFRKQLEYGVKSLRYGDDMSVIPPSQYASRFISFITAVAD